jgi:hypothetical protein
MTADSLRSRRSARMGMEKNFNANGRKYPRTSANGVQHRLTRVGGEGEGTQREWGRNGTRMGADSEVGIRFAPVDERRIAPHWSWNTGIEMKNK